MREGGREGAGGVCVWRAVAGVCGSLYRWFLCGVALTLFHLATLWLPEALLWRRGIASYTPGNLRMGQRRAVRGSGVRRPQTGGQSSEVRGQSRRSEVGGGRKAEDLKGEGLR